MAVDTRNRRMSMIGLALPVPRVFPDPDSAVDTAAERQQHIYLYAGIDAAEPPVGGLGGRMMLTQVG